MSQPPSSSTNVRAPLRLPGCKAICDMNFGGKFPPTGSRPAAWNDRLLISWRCSPPHAFQELRACPHSSKFLILANARAFPRASASSFASDPKLSDTVKKRGRLPNSILRHSLGQQRYRRLFQESVSHTLWTSCVGQCRRSRHRTKFYHIFNSNPTRRPHTLMSLDVEATEWLIFVKRCFQAISASSGSPSCLRPAKWAQRAHLAASNAAWARSSRQRTPAGRFRMREDVSLEKVRHASPGTRGAQAPAAATDNGARSCSVSTTISQRCARTP